MQIKWSNENDNNDDNGGATTIEIYSLPEIIVGLRNIHAFAFKLCLFLTMQ